MLANAISIKISFAGSCACPYKNTVFNLINVHAVMSKGVALYGLLTVYELRTFRKSSGLISNLKCG